MPSAPKPAPKTPKRDTFTHVSVISRPMPNADVEPGDGHFVLGLALAAGLRPVGDPHVADVADDVLEPSVQRVTWAVDVVSNDIAELRA